MNVRCEECVASCTEYPLGVPHIVSAWVSAGAFVYVSEMRGSVCEQCLMWVIVLSARGVRNEKVVGDV